MRIPLLTLALVAATAAPASAVEFKFAPTDGLECDQRLVSTKSTTIQDHDDARRVETGESTTHLKYEKTATGYRVHTTVISGEMKRDGKLVDEPFTKVLIGKQLTMDLGPNGEMLDVQGYDVIISALIDSLPEEAREAAGKVMTVENLRERDKAEWNGRISEFVGKQAKEGDVWQGQSEFPLPSGPVKLSSVTKFTKIDESKGKPEVTISFAFAADGPSAKAAMDRIFQDLSSLTKGFDPKAGEPSIAGGGERTIDASTMTIAHETLTRNVAMPMELPQVGTAVLLRSETREYTTDCK